MGAFPSLCAEDPVGALPSDPEVEWRLRIPIHRPSIPSSACYSFLEVQIGVGSGYRLHRGRALWYRDIYALDVCHPGSCGHDPRIRRQ